ncbi:MAG TPA: DnaJ domain-containing protein [Kofleriaceae bacterium]|nr:DnaJ domain-containing protein [Kofleriaceae bacterium]
MDLAEAYRWLEIAPGATKEATREARNVLAKVWHPDRHQGDPKLHDRAADKLRQINEAYATIEHAGFPAAEAPRPREAPPAYVDSLRPHVQPQPRTTAPHATTQKSRARSTSELTPQRRVRMWVLILLGAVAAAAAVITVVIVKHRNAPVGESAAPVAMVTPLADAADGFTLGSSKEEVRRVMGPPTSVDTTFGERWSYGMAEVDFRDDKVFAWRSSAFDRLKVRFPPHDPKVAAAARARGSYGEHASRDEVLGVEGPPDGLDYTFGETWEYGMSNVKFIDGHIDTVWNTHARPLHVAPTAP